MAARSPQGLDLERRRFAGLVLLVAATTSPALAVNYAWTGTTGDWSVPANWSPTSTPTVGDTATVATGSSPYTVTVASPTATDTLTLNAAMATLSIPATSGLTLQRFDLRAGTATGTVDLVGPVPNGFTGASVCYFGNGVSDAAGLTLRAVGSLQVQRAAAAVRATPVGLRIELRNRTGAVTAISLPSSSFPAPYDIGFGSPNLTGSINRSDVFVALSASVASVSQTAEFTTNAFFANEGTITFADADAPTAASNFRHFNAATLFNAPGASITVGQNCRVEQTNFNGGFVSLVNRGTISVAAGSSYTVAQIVQQPGGRFAGEASSTVSTGSLTSAGGTMSGTFVTSSGWSVTGAAAVGGSIGGSGSATVGYEGTLQVGVPVGSLAVNRSLTGAPNSAIEFELAGTEAGVTYDRLDIAGAASMSNTAVKVKLASGFVPDPGSTFGIVTSTSTPSFQSVQNATGLAGLIVTPTYSTTGLSIAVTSALPADPNYDGAVNFADLLTVAQHYGQPGRWADGDLTGDDVVNFADLLLLAQHYGSTVPGVTVGPVGAFTSDWAMAQTLAAGGTVPEPASALAIGAVGITLLSRPRRGR